MDVKKNRSLRFLLVVAMLVSMFSTTAFAAENHAGITGEVTSVADSNALVYPVTSITVNQPYKEGSIWYVDAVIYGNPDSVVGELDLRRVTNFTSHVSGTTHYLTYTLGRVDEGNHTFELIVVSDYTARVFRKSVTFYE